MFFVSAVRGFQVGRVGQLGEEADGARRVPDLGQSFLKIEKRSFKRAFSFCLLNFLVCLGTKSDQLLASLKIQSYKDMATLAQFLEVRPKISNFSYLQILSN